MTRLPLILSAAVLLAGCSRHTSTAHRSANGAPISLLEARRGFQTKLVRREHDHTPADPPPNDLQLVEYPSEVGPLQAYLSTPRNDGQRRPAIIWLFGGFDNGIGDTAWKPATPDNDQSAQIFRVAGIVTMYPSLRGGNTNPGYKEAFCGEVNDVLAALDFLSRRPDVDPNQIYLGGHSTGGTLALLVAEATDRFRAVFAFGPVARVKGYGAANLPFDTSDPKEFELRDPIEYLDAIRRPTYVFEGTDNDSNIGSLLQLKAATSNRYVICKPIQGRDHFSDLATVTPSLVRYILGVASGNAPPNP